MKKRYSIIGYTGITKINNMGTEEVNVLKMHLMCPTSYLCVHHWQLSNCGGEGGKGEPGLPGVGKNFKACWPYPK